MTESFFSAHIEERNFLNIFATFKSLVISNQKKQIAHIYNKVAKEPTDVSANMPVT